MPGKRAPAASELEHLHPWFQSQLATHQIELRALRVVEVCGPLPVGTGIDQRLAQHRLVEIVAEVVVTLDRPASSHRALGIPQPSCCEADRAAPAREGMRHPGPDQPGGEVVEPVGVPLPVDVGLAQTEATVAEDAPIEAAVVHPDVLPAIAPHPDVGGFEEVSYGP